MNDIKKYMESSVDNDVRWLVFTAGAAISILAVTVPQGETGTPLMWVAYYFLTFSATLFAISSLFGAMVAALLGISLSEHDCFARDRLLWWSGKFGAAFVVTAPIAIYLNTILI